MWFTPLTLTLITTHRCTAACEHCCFACTPSRTEAIPLPRLHALVEETREVPSIAQVVFTGGECFLLGRELDALVARCAARGLLTRCVTNGYWAVNPRAAAARVADLAAAGLTELNFSTGEQHARFVPWERVAWGAAAAAEAGMPDVTINAEAFQGTTFDVQALEGHPALRPRLADGSVRLIRGPWIPNGFDWRGNDGSGILEHAPEHLRFRMPDPGACESSLRTLAVTPELDLVTCCGLNLEHIPQLHAASLADRTLREALEAVPPDLLKMWIHVEGPEKVLAFVREKLPDLPLPLESAHMCHTCRYLYGSREALEVIRRHGREVEARILDAFLLASAAEAISAAL